MKIAFLSFYSGINQRGVERWVQELATRLSDKYSVTVYQGRSLDKITSYKIISQDVNYDIRNRTKNWFLTHLYVDYNSLQILKFNLRILKGLLSGSYDIIIPTDGGWESAIIRILTWIKRKKMVIVGHAGIGWDDLNNLWSLPDCFVALSEHAKIWARKINPFIKIEYIPDGVDLALFTPKGSKLKFNLNKPIALCVSALEKGKRIDLIIKAVSKIDNMNLLVCGRGEQKDELNRLGKELLGKRFELKAYEFNEMPEVYRSCDIFLSSSLPSYSFEMVLLEAMASGLPVVANSDQIRREIIGDAGLLVDVNDTEKFAESIKKVSSTNYSNLPLYQARKYSWDEISERFRILFDKLSIV